MTPREAREILGVERGDERAKIRRAYMKAVRAHPPERDPEGFQRVRAAYELLERRDLLDAQRVVLTEDLPLAPITAQVLETASRPNGESPDRPVSKSLSLQQRPGEDEKADHPFEEKTPSSHEYYRLIEGGERTKAAELVLPLLQDLSLSVPDVALLLRHVLLLEKDGEALRARQVFDALMQRLDGEGTAVTSLDECFELWATVRDFLRVREQMRPIARRLISAHLARPNWTDTAPSWRALEKRNPQHRDELMWARNIVREQAPAIEAILSRRPFSSGHPAKPAPGSEKKLSGWAISGLTGIYLVWVFLTFLSSPRWAYTPPDPTSDASTLTMIPRVERPPETFPSQEARCPVKRILEDLQHAKAEGECSRLSEFFIDLRRCESVQTALDDFAYAAELENLDLELKKRGCDRR